MTITPALGMSDVRTPDLDTGLMLGPAHEDFTITEKAPTRAFSWLKAPTSAFTFKTLC